MIQRLVVCALNQMARLLPDCFDSPSVAVVFHGEEWRSEKVDGRTSAVPSASLLYWQNDWLLRPQQIHFQCAASLVAIPSKLLCESDA
jgi:hypothetical protein